MGNLFIATTSTEGLRPLGTAPQRSYELIIGSVADTQAALMFAEPVSSDYGDTVDWYTERTGRVRPLSGLDEEAQAALRARLQELVAKVRAQADKLGEADETDTDSLRLGEALSNALEIPGEDSIYAVIAPDGTVEPVLVNWAWVEDRQSAVRGVLSGVDTRQAAEAAAAAAAAQAAAARARADDATAEDVAEPERAAVVATEPSALWWWLYGLGWLILALLTATILLLLIAPCGLRLPGVPSFCPVGQASASELDRRTTMLRDQVAAVEREIAMMDRACQPDPERPDFLPPRTVVEPRPVVPPAAEPDLAEIDRLDRAGAQIGELTFSLIWDGPDDLDLEVTCPGGERLFWGIRSACGGRVDIDTGVGEPSPEPVENIFFETPAPGAYTVRVTMPTSRRNGAPQPFRMLVREGDQVEAFEGIVSGREIEWSHVYEFGGQR